MLGTREAFTTSSTWAPVRIVPLKSSTPGPLLLGSCTERGCRQRRSCSRDCMKYARWESTPDLPRTCKQNPATAATYVCVALPRNLGILDYIQVAELARLADFGKTADSQGIQSCDRPDGLPIQVPFVKLFDVRTLRHCWSPGVLAAADAVVALAQGVVGIPAIEQELNGCTHNHQATTKLIRSANPCEQCRVAPLLVPGDRSWRELAWCQRCRISTMSYHFLSCFFLSFPVLSCPAVSCFASPPPTLCRVLPCFPSPTLPLRACGLPPGVSPQVRAMRRHAARRYTATRAQISLSPHILVP